MKSLNLFVIFILFFSCKSIKQPIDSKNATDEVNIIKFVLNKMNNVDNLAVVNEIDPINKTSINFWKDYIDKYKNKDSVFLKAFSDENIICYDKKQKEEMKILQIIPKGNNWNIISKNKVSNYMKSHRNKKVLIISRPLISCDGKIAIIKNQFYSLNNDVWLEPMFRILIKENKDWKYY